MVMLVRILTRCQGVKEAIVASAPPPLLGAKLWGAVLAALALGASGKTSLFFPYSELGSHEFAIFSPFLGRTVIEI